MKMYRNKLTQEQVDAFVRNAPERHRRIINDMKLMMKEGRCHTETLQPFDLKKCEEKGS